MRHKSYSAISSLREPHRLSIFCFMSRNCQKNKHIFTLLAYLRISSLYFCHRISESIFLPLYFWEKSKMVRRQQMQMQRKRGSMTTSLNNSRIWNDYMLCISQFTSCQSLRELQSLPMCFLTNSTMNDNPHNDISSPLSFPNGIFLMSIQPRISPAWRVILFHFQKYTTTHIPLKIHR